MAGRTRSCRRPGEPDSGEVPLLPGPLRAPGLPCTLRRVSRTALIALLLAIPAAPAQARPRGATVSDPVAAAVRRAVAYWHGTPCGGHVAVVGAAPGEAPAAGQNVPGLHGAEAAMWATFRAPGSTDAFAEPPSSYSECVVHVNRRTWPEWRAEDAHFAAFCKEMVHEFGHFEGYPDAGARPGTIQYERPDLARLPLCERFRLVYGHEVFTGQPRPG